MHTLPFAQTNRVLSCSHLTNQPAFCVTGHVTEQAPPTFRQGSSPPPPLLWCMCVCTLHSAICVSAYDPLMHMHTGMTPAHTHTHNTIYATQCITLLYGTLSTANAHSHFQFPVCLYIVCVALIHCLSRAFFFLGDYHKLFCVITLCVCVCVCVFTMFTVDDALA